MIEELKPCPFCGGEAYLNQNVVSIHCPTCCGIGISASVHVKRLLGQADMEKCTKQAISAWNTRAESKLLEALEIISTASACQYSKNIANEAIKATK